MAQPEATGQLEVLNQDCGCGCGCDSKAEATAIKADERKRVER